MNREVNIIVFKLVDIDMINKVIEIKNIIEKIRE